MSSVTFRYRWICFELSPASSPMISTVFFLSFSWSTWPLFLRPLLRLMASYFIFNAKAFSLGRSTSRWRLLSIMLITASSSFRTRMITGSFLYPSFWAAYFRRWPEMISYQPSGTGRTIRGFKTPYLLMLSMRFSICGSSLTLKGCPRKGWRRSSSISTTFSSDAISSAFPDICGIPSFLVSDPTAGQESETQKSPPGSWLSFRT